MHADALIMTVQTVQQPLRSVSTTLLIFPPSRRFVGCEATVRVSTLNSSRASGVRSNAPKRIMEVAFSVNS